MENPDKIFREALVFVNVPVNLNFIIWDVTGMMSLIKSKALRFLPALFKGTDQSSALLCSSACTGRAKEELRTCFMI